VSSSSSETNRSFGTVYFPAQLLSSIPTHNTTELENSASQANTHRLQHLSLQTSFCLTHDGVKISCKAWRKCGYLPALGSVERFEKMTLTQQARNPLPSAERAAWCLCLFELASEPAKQTKVVTLLACNHEVADLKTSRHTDCPNWKCLSISFSRQR
jgi:hypothetical protein